MRVANCEKCGKQVSKLISALCEECFDALPDWNPVCDRCGLSLNNNENPWVIVCPIHGEQTRLSKKV